MQNSHGFRYADANEIESVIKFLKDRYKPIDNAFDGMMWLVHGSMYYIVSKDLMGKIDLRDIIHGGLRAVRISESGQYKITTDFVQVFGAYFKRNVFVLKKQDVTDFLKGKMIKVSGNMDSELTRGYIAVKIDTGDFLGCGFFDGMFVRSQIPKDRTLNMGITD